MGEKYPQLKDMKSSEIFVEMVRVFKDNHHSFISIGRIIDKKDQSGMIKALQGQLATKDIYLVTISK